MKKSILQAISPTRVIHNMEFSCPAASTKRSMEFPGCIHCSRQALRGQLQRFVMTTIRVMARPQRAKPSAHATRATPGKTHSVSKLRAARRLSQNAVVSTTCKQSKFASIQFRRTYPAPSHNITKCDVFSLFLFVSHLPCVRSGSGLRPSIGIFNTKNNFTILNNRIPFL